MKMIKAVVVIVFLLGLVNTATTAEKPYGLDYSLKGKVIALDLLKQTLTIKPTDIGRLTADGEFTFVINAMTNVRMCGQDKTVEDINVGDVVTVGYSTEGSKFYANTINMPTPLLACLLDEK